MAQRESLNRRSRARDDDDRPRRSSRDDDRSERRASSRPSRGREERGGGTKWKGYTKRKSEDVRRRAEQTGGSYDSFVRQGIDMFRPKAGDNTIRYLPPTWENADHYGYDVWIHSYVGVDESSYLCLDKNKKERCPLCIAAKEAREAGDDDEYKALKPRQRVLAWILDRDGEDDTKPMLYDMSWSFDRDVAALCDTKRGTLFIDNPDEGYDLTFKRKGQGLNTRYFGSQVDREPTPIVEDQRTQDEILDFITENPIPEVLKYYDADHLQKVIEGTTQQPDEDLDAEDAEEEKPARGRGRDRDDDDERPARTSRARTRNGEDDDERPSRARARDRDEEDPEDEPEPEEPDAEEEPDEEERPRRGTRRASRDADEDDERPARRARR